jgi:hypothetical protein
MFGFHDVTLTLGPNNSLMYRASLSSAVEGGQKLAEVAPSGLSGQ